MLKSVSLDSFRNLNLSLEFSPGVNIVYGNNGAGKSSILEAIHYLSFGRSFRASHASQMIAHGSDGYTIHAEVERDGFNQKISIHRPNAAAQVKINSSVASMIKVAALTPTLFIDCDSHRNYFNSSQHRRRLFDWLLFHVERDYLSSFKVYNKALKQRNAALKQGMSTTPWDQVMSIEAICLHEMRKEVFEIFLNKVEEEHYSFKNMILSYMPGYNVNENFEDVLKKARNKDEKVGYTTEGPHKADWRLLVDDRNASEILSQGQQKVAYLKLILIHYEIMVDHGIIPTVLVDDVPAELDAQHKILVQDFLSKLDCQAIVTSVDTKSLDWAKQEKRFHVEHGTVVNA